MKGRFVSVVRIKPPAVMDPVLVQQLKDIDARINQRN
jgi:hypothetical protein